MSEQRLIDANTVVTIQVFDEMTEEYRMETITVAKAIDRWSDEGCPPTIDAVPVVHARWEKTSDGCRTRCSSCKIRLPGVWYYNGEDCDENYEEIDATPFCPACGAKMDGGDAHGQQDDRT